MLKTPVVVCVPTLAALTFVTRKNDVPTVT